MDISLKGAISLEKLVKLIEELTPEEKGILKKSSKNLFKKT